MEELLRAVDSLSQQCASISLVRRAKTRNTHLKKKLAKIGRPLASALNRLRRGLVLCTEAEFERHVRDVLASFYFEVHALVRSLGNGERIPEVLALVEAARVFEQTGYIS